jgi:hypothetical protein
MGSIWIRDFTGGLDTRKLAETTPGGVLIQALNGHITRGGEFEKRASFVSAYALPSGTVGLARQRTGLVVFGSGDPPAMPAGVTYQQLQHPDGVTALTRVPSFDLFAGLIYAVGEFADGSLYHFYDGLQVEDWFDGRARASFTIIAGTGSSTLDHIYVNGVDVLSAPVTWTTDNSTTAQAVADAVNANLSVPEYVATANGDNVNLIAQDTGSQANGRAVVFAVSGGFTISPASGLVMSGGGGDYVAAKGAKTRFNVAVGIVNALTTARVGSVALIGARVTTRNTVNQTAAAIAAAINTFNSVPEYTATSAGAVVTVTAPVGTSYNGDTLTLAKTGDLTYTTPAVFAGGTGSIGATTSFTITAGTANKMTVINAAGVSLMGGEILLTTTTAAFVVAIVAAINGNTGVTGYTATVDETSNEKIEVVAPPADGAAANGRKITYAATGNVSLTGLKSFSGGRSLVDVQLPGSYVKTIGAKMYSVSGPNLHFSGIQQPTLWTTDAPGAGFIDMSSYSSGSEVLQAVETYQNNIAIFGETAVQIWYVDPDPALNTRSQTLNNTGTTCPRSVTQFSDNDLFYLNESGLRSLRARDATNSASTTDIGVPVDTLISAKLKPMTDSQRANVIGLIEPGDNRFWLIMGSDIFVFSFFSGAKVSAWTLYSTGFSISDAVIFDHRVYLRSGNSVYVYGGIGNDLVYDATQAVAQIPYVDADDPTRTKNWQGVDVAASGQWDVYFALKPQKPDAKDKVGGINNSTFDQGRISANGQSTHCSAIFKSKGSGPAKLGSAVIQFEGSGDAD